MEMLPLMRKAVANEDWKIVGEYLSRNPDDKTILDYLRNYVPIELQREWDKFHTSKTHYVGKAIICGYIQVEIGDCNIATPFGNRHPHSLYALELSEGLLRSYDFEREGVLYAVLRGNTNIVPMFGLTPQSGSWRAILSPLPAPKFFQGPTAKLCRISNFDSDIRGLHLD